MRLSTVLPAGLILLLAVSAAAQAAEPAPAPGDAEPVRVTASIYPITMLIEEIGGDLVNVTTVVRPGVDPHHFEITPSGAKAIYESDAVFMIGADFDSYITGDEPLGTQIRVEFYESFADSLIELGHTFNPHFWLDPVLAGKMAEQIGLTLITTDYANHAYYEERMARFAARMDSLHAEVKERLARTGLKVFVSYHPAWTYFARRYSLTEVGVVEKFPEHEPSARWVADLMLEMKRQDVHLLIVEETSHPGVVRGMAKDMGIRVLSLDPIGNPDAAGRDTYFGLMGYNVSLIEKAVRGD